MDQHKQEGFSSEQEPDVQTIKGQNLNLIDELEVQKIRIHALSKVHPAQEIKKKQYSLEPDMMTGWKPKTYLPKPIPLIFYNDQLDYAIEKLIKMKTFRHQASEENQSFIQLVYLGPRYQSTYSAWYEKPFDFPYTHLNKNKRLKFTDREFVGQYWNAETQNHLHFDSFFQSGNLDVVFKIGELQYDLFMRVDSNTRGHLQWYNFKVKNMKKGCIYRFNICNFTKAKSLYTRGMKPFIFSKKLFESKKVSWTQCGQNIKYEKKTPKSFKICKIQIDEKPFRLSFNYECEYQNDQIQFSYCIPYEYSRLKRYIEDLQRRCQGKNFLKVSRLSHTLGGLQIPIITITSNLREKNQKQFSNKKLIVASGRIHPGQSNGSFMIEGFIEYLCNNSQECQQLRDSIVFKIIPMVNPDGVVLGNYRTSLSGKDLNREFINPEQYLFPEVFHLKKYMWKLKSLYRKDFLMYLDFHGHSTKKNCFTYGPQFSITNNSYYQCRIFPKLISMHTQMFRYFSCIFKISECKQRTLRAVLLKNLQVDFVYTIEVSNGCFYNHELMEDVYFDEQKWLQLGRKIGKSVNQYTMIFRELDKMKQRKKQERIKLKRDKQKYKMRSTMVKRQNAMQPRERLSLSIIRAPFSSKTGVESTSVSKFSPNKRKTLGFSNSEFVASQKLLQMPLDLQFTNDQNPFYLPEFKDQKLSLLMKEIYGNPNQNLASSKNENQHNQQIQIKSDDNISEGGSDSSSSSQDLNQTFKKQLFQNIKSGSERFPLFHSPHKRKPHNLTATNSPVKTYEDESTFVQNQTDIFFTDIGDSSNDLQDFRTQNKMNSLKMNQLRSKRRIYLKKKSYQLNITPSPKKQVQNNATAKIVNFEFSLNPIRPSSHLWQEKQQQSNTIHSLFKQDSKSKFDQRQRKVTTFTDYMNKTATQRSQKRESNLSSLKKQGFSVEKPVSASFNNIHAAKHNGIALLRKTQERKMKINPNFYKTVKPNKEIEDDNLKGQRILSSSRKQRCLTEVCED